MLDNKTKGYIFSFLSAFLYALDVPISKIYLDSVSSNELLFLMYLGSALGVFLIIMFSKSRKLLLKKDKVTSKIIMIIICDIFASLLITESLYYLPANVVSLMSVLEIVFTVIFASLMLGEKMSKNLILSAIFVTIGGILVSIDSYNCVIFSIFIVFTIIATILWGIENNLTAKVSSNNPLVLVFYKCLAVSLFNLVFIINKVNIHMLIQNYWYLLIIGFFVFGMSILFFAYATRYIGASRTSIIFSLSPIFSTVLSIIIFKNKVNNLFIVSLLFMLLGIYFTCFSKDKS